jgi:hypothetical protein
MQVSCNRVREIVRVRSKCVTAPTSQATTAHPRPPARPARAPALRRRLCGPQTARLWCFRPASFDPPLQAVAAEWVGYNAILCTSYGVSFYRVKPTKGGEGDPAWIYDGDDDPSPPSDFFSPTGPPLRTGSRTCRHAMLHLACVVGRTSVPSLVI